MVRNFLVFLVFCFCAPTVFAQDSDSIAFVNAKWKKIHIAKNTRFVSHHFNTKNLFSANQHISYIEVDQGKKSPLFAIANEAKVLKPTSGFGKENEAIAALNGTFFDMKNGGSVDLIKQNGQITAGNRLANGKRTANQQAAITIFNGRLNIKKWDGSADWEQQLPDTDIMVSGPLLRIDKRDEALDSSPFNANRHPRTVVGIKPDGRVILLVIDGRSPNSSGASLPELTKIMRWLGCSSAINLDGGGSSTLWINSISGNGVANYPCDNKLWDHDGERNVANVLLLKKRP